MRLKDPGSQSLSCQVWTFIWIKPHLLAHSTDKNSTNAMIEDNYPARFMRIYFWNKMLKAVGISPKSLFFHKSIKSHQLVLHTHPHTHIPTHLEPSALLEQGFVQEGMRTIRHWARVFVTISLNCFVHCCKRAGCNKASHRVSNKIYPKERKFTKYWSQALRWPNCLRLILEGCMKQDYKTYFFVLYRLSNLPLYVL